MALINDMYTLVTQGARYAATPNAVHELPHFFHDLMLGSSFHAKHPHFLYADLHAHFRKDVRICDLIEKASERVDILAITSRTIGSNKYNLTFEQAIQKMQEERIAYRYLSQSDKRVAVVHGFKEPFYLVRGIEVPVKEKQSVVMVGNKEDFQREELSLEEAIKASNEAGSLWFLDHLFSIYTPLISFRYPTSEELQQREEWCERYHPVLEVGNHQNTLWMYPSNIAAQVLARKYDLTGIANSDTHFNVGDVGRSRTVIPKDRLDVSSEQAFFDSLREVFSHPEIVRTESNYSSIWAFSRYMILPTVLSAMKLDNEVSSS